jgi:hypothetical protein
MVGRDQRNQLLNNRMEWHGPSCSIMVDPSVSGYSGSVLTHGLTCPNCAA